jgi:hypothetical protein
MSTHSHESDSDDVHQPKDWNIETGCSDQDEGMGGAADKSDEKDLQTRSRNLKPQARRST